MTRISLRRVYDPAPANEDQPVLVDRLWPRGVSKANARIDLWLKEVAPSTALRQWFGHDPARWTGFKQRYRTELKHNPAWPELQALAQQKDLTLVYAARDQAHNEAVVLKQLLEQD